MIATSVEIEFLPGNLSSGHLDHHMNGLGMMNDDSSCLSASNHSCSSSYSRFSSFRPSAGFFYRQNDDASELGQEDMVSEAGDLRYSHHQRRGTFVRFASDEKGKLLTERYTYKSYSRAERKNMWYRGRDFKSFAKRARTKAQNGRDYLQMVEDMRLMCHRGGELRNRAGVLHQFCHCVAESPYRGLEPFLEGTNERRKQVIQSVLDEQDQWRALGSVLTEDERISALGDHCRSMSKAHRRISHLMAVGDVMVTKKDKSKVGHRVNDPNVLALDHLEI